MQIEILGAESLGVRGLFCLIKTKNRRIVIDPGVALGYRRYGLLPHPVQVAASEIVKDKIKTALEGATDVVLSHFHGDHIPLVDANPYQLSAQSVVELFKTAKIWAKGKENISYHQLQRTKALEKILNRKLTSAEGLNDGILSFSHSVPHGEIGNGYVMMTRIEEGKEVFVHASDIEMLNDESIETILKWKTTTVLASGPPIYLPRLTRKMRENAWQRALRLAQEVETLILDHHLLRCLEGERWLNRLSYVTGKRVMCAADFMGRRRRLLEANRRLWYKKMPVPEGWHEAYSIGEINAQFYRKFL